MIIRVAEKLFRGPRPESYEQLKRDCPGVVAVLMLESGLHELAHDDQYEKDRKNPTAHGIFELANPTSAIWEPEVIELRKLAGSIESLRTHFGVTYVHCAHGVDRTGLAIASWRILFDGWTVDQARDEMFARGFHRFPYEQWARLLEQLK